MPVVLDDLRREAARRGARVAVVLTGVQWCALGPLHLGASAVFASFATFSLLVFADFRGPLPRRCGRYLLAGALGLVAVALGTVVAGSPWLAGGVAVLVGFAAVVSSALRGAVAAGASSVQLGYIIAATGGPAMAALPERLFGWSVGSVCAALGAVLLWPSPDRGELRERAADVLAAAADLVRVRWRDVPDVARAAGLEDDLVAAYARLRAAFRGRLTRPGGTTERERALLALVEELSRLTAIVQWRPATDVPGPPGDPALGSCTADALEASARALRGEGPLPSIEPLTLVREQHREETARWAAAQLRGAGARGGRDTLEAGFALRIVSLVAAFLAADTCGALGGAGVWPQVTSMGTPVPPPLWTATPWALLRAHLDTRSPWFRNAVRSGAGVGLAVLVALLLGVDHAFWVVLGTLSVLRFDVIGTGRTAVQAIVGTTGGALLGTALAILVGDHLGIYWALLPLSAFAATYLPTAVSYLVGQAAFTTFVVVVFSIAAGPSVLTGVTRLEDVLLGIAVSLVVGLLLWPRGVLAQVRTTLADALDAVAAHLLRCVEALLGQAGDDDVTATRRRAADASSRAYEAFDLALVQRTPGRLHLTAWARLAGTGLHLLQAADMIDFLRQQRAVGVGPDEVDGPPDVLAGTPFAPVAAAAARAEAADLQRTAERLRALRDQRAPGLEVDDDLPLPPGGAVTATTRDLDAGVVRTFAGWSHRADRGIGPDALLVSWAADQLGYADWLTRCAEGAAAAVMAASVEPGPAQGNYRKA
jgi:uncharacterized membrane protein YccC